MRSAAHMKHGSGALGCSPCFWAVQAAMRARRSVLVSRLPPPRWSSLSLQHCQGVRTPVKPTQAIGIPCQDT